MISVQEDVRGDPLDFLWAHNPPSWLFQKIPDRTLPQDGIVIITALSALPAVNDYDPLFAALEPMTRYRVISPSIPFISTS